MNAGSQITTSSVLNFVPLSPPIMPPRELTKHQLSSKLSYSQGTPAFLQRLKNQVAGVSSRDEEEEFDEWEASSGRPPIPRRPSPPQRPEDDPGSADEDDDEEKPQIVVLREGKHMSAVEVENEKRKGEPISSWTRYYITSTNVQNLTAKGLPPVSTSPHDGDSLPPGSTPSKKDRLQDKSNTKSNSLSFASFGTGSKASSSSKKRKIIGEDDDLKRLAGKESKPEKKAKRDKTKKVGALLSFDESNEG